MLEALELKICGIVQGVGFRPFVYRTAHEFGLTGWVLNATEGVFVHAEGDADSLDRFTITLSDAAPAAARVDEINIKEVPVEGFDTFEIRFSEEGETQETTLVSPDLATCDACVEELFDPDDRRYRYPFINCTNCGPRFTIMRSLPYDRPATSMQPFAMCPDCQAEYDDPADRRFHAQPDACFECGPHLGWAVSADPDSADVLQAAGVTADAANVAAGDGTADDTPGVSDITWAHNREESDMLLSRAVSLLWAGGIVAVKGLGGYHLVCDASNAQALVRLRARKRREGKAFAVMVADVAAAEALCFVNDAERTQLTSPARPIMLLRKRPEATFAAGLADDLPELGVMLPTTPVQHLLMHDFGGMLVMTSGNIHDEPIVVDEATAFSQLGRVADAFLVNDRAIEGRYDDSVVRVIDGGAAGEIVQVVRRARGLAPLPLAIPMPEDPETTEVFATGPEQKNTFTYTRAGEAFTSQHIGDMESVAVMDAWHETRGRYADLFRLKPTRIAYDYHPEYLTSKWAEGQDTPAVQVQHHHAHILSVMGENSLEGPACGFAFDGTGYGLDGCIWGGEVLLSNLHAFERFANFAYFPLPGGAAAIKEPARIAYGVLWAYDLLDHEAVQDFLARAVPNATMYDQMIERGLNCPQASSVGRLFDAASALLGICERPRYEGEAAILLEAAVHSGLAAGTVPAADDDAEATDRYAVSIIKNTATETSTAQDTSVLLMDAAPTFEALLDDLQAGVSRETIARRFHDAFARVIVDVAELVRALYGIETLALGGGVFMNRYLLERSLEQLQRHGFTVALNCDLPPNDASISYGQAVLALQAQTKE